MIGRALKLGVAGGVLYGMFDWLTSPAVRPGYAQYNSGVVSLSMFVGSFVVGFGIVFIASLVLLWAFKKKAA